HCCFVLVPRRYRHSTLFPYTTLFRSKKAQAEGMRSRAAYKLEELVARDRLLKPGMVVVDLGAAPGGWSQCVRQALGDSGRVVARSEEHTSELQSRENLVCRLLLEKKK